MKKELIALILLLVFLFGCVEAPEEKQDVLVACENADEGNLCGGLDFVFGEGYESTCCQDFRVCCG